MEAVPLEKAPKVAVYTPPDAPPWDDAVTLALKYAGIEYTPIWDDEVERGDLTKYDWLHLHHEDFTGQLNKFYLSYRDAPWFIELLQKNTATAKRLGFANVPGLKKAVAEQDSRVRRARRLPVRDVRRDRDARAGDRRRERRHRAELHRRHADGSRRRSQDGLGKTLAFQDAHLEQSPFVNSMSDIDGHQVNVPGRRQPLGTFTLFNFSAKFDPVPRCSCRTTAP